MGYYGKLTWALVFLLLATFAAGAFAALAFQIAPCDAQAAGLNIPHRWSRMGGCQVHDPQAGWVPLANYRVF